MTQGKRSKRNADGEFARLQLEPQPPPLRAAAPASLLSRKRTGEVRFAALRTTQKKNLRAKWRPRHFAISTGCRGHPCPRRCGTHGGFRIKSSDLPFPVLPLRQSQHALADYVVLDLIRPGVDCRPARREHPERPLAFVERERRVEFELTEGPQQLHRVERNLEAE